jgi:CheY-like chemotaxis protein
VAGNVKADPAQLQEVILNLVINARDAMPNGGRLTIETTRVELNESYARTHPEVKTGVYALLSVSDTGSGMTEATRARIFEPFFTTKEAGQGTGLGLSVVYGVVQQCGGHVSVESELGAGTTFKIYLRWAVQSCEAPAGETTGRPSRGGTETILLVEDDDAVRAFADRILTDRGYTVISVHNGQQALATSAAYGRNIDLLLSDVIMPQMSGHEVADKLKRDRPRIKVLFISGYAEAAIARNGVLKQGTEFLQKPFSPDALSKKVRELLDTIDDAVQPQD